MALHLTDRYPCDPRARMLQTLSARERVPRFLFVCTHHATLWRFRADVSALAVRELSRYAGKEAVLSESRSHPERLRSFEQVLAAEAARAEGEERSQGKDAQSCSEFFRLGDARSERETEDGAAQFEADGGVLRVCAGMPLLELPAGRKLAPGLAEKWELRLVARLSEFF
jgi:hypothetical protein